MLIISKNWANQNPNLKPGRLIKSNSLDNENGFSIDLSNFERGLYFISIKSEEKIDNLKFLVK